MRCDFSGYTFSDDGLRRIYARLQQLRHVALDLFELIEVQIRIGNREDVTGLGMLVDKNSLAVAPELLLHFQDAFALQHHGENVGGGRVARIILRDDFSQHRLGGFLLNGINRMRGRRFVSSVPL